VPQPEDLSKVHKSSTRAASVGTALEQEPCPRLIMAATRRFKYKSCLGRPGLGVVIDATLVAVAGVIPPLVRQKRRFTIRRPRGAEISRECGLPVSARPRRRAGARGYGLRGCIGRCGEVLRPVGRENRPGRRTRRHRRSARRRFICRISTTPRSRLCTSARPTPLASRMTCLMPRPFPVRRSRHSM
jgi:hypothetical protein